MASAEEKKQAWKDELDEIAAEHDGILRAEDVVNFAKNEDTALHEKFTWDDTEAAHQYRLWEARELISVSVVMLPGANGNGVKAFVSLKDDRTQTGGGYRSVVSVLNNAKMRAALLREALEEFDAWGQKYNSLKELSRIFTARKRINKRAS